MTRHDRKRPLRTRRLQLEPLEDRALLTAVPFSGPMVIQEPVADGAYAVVSADLDGDGDPDIIAGTIFDNSILWFENRLNEPMADFGPPQLITQQVSTLVSLFASDIDGDGDPDLLSASRFDDKIAWYENRLNEPTADFASQRVITTDADNAYSVFASDLDGDGDHDVLSASSSDDKIAWYENRLDEATADFGPQQVITTSANQARSVFAADLDGDGDADVLSASSFDDKVAWYENRLNEPTADFGPQQLISTSANGARSVFTSDLDGDGDADVLSASTVDDEIAWYENRLDELTEDFGQKQVISTSFNNVVSIFAVDLDDDGDSDVLSASKFDDKIAWYENRLDEATADFGPQQVITRSVNSPVSVFASDLDGDGDSDVMSASVFDDKVAWYENRLDQPSADFGPQQVINHSAWFATSIFAPDLDGDGNPDVLAAFSLDDKIAWYENRLDEMTADFGTQQVITTNANSVDSVFASDLDGDGDYDVLSASSSGPDIAWYENRLDEPTADFGPQQVISNSAWRAESVFASDLDGDGDKDVLSASYYDNKIAWYENRLDEATADFGPQQVITTNAPGAHSVITADLDGDGDPDVLSESASDLQEDSRLAWYENRLDEPTVDFGPQQVINSSFPFAGSLFVSDVDSDGDQDLLVTLYTQLAWYENRLDEPTADFSPAQVIATNAEIANSVFASDLDGDGDLDIVSASLRDDKLAWYENRLDDPTADFGSQQVISTSGDGAQHVFASDLDGDGDPDILSASRFDAKIAWYRNERIGPVGDMDLDTDVDVDDVDDFVQALVDPEGYRADHGGLSPAARGDIDGDGDLDVDDVDDFVELLTGPAAGGGQASTAPSTNRSTTDAPQGTTAANATPLQSPAPAPTVDDTSSVPNVRPLSIAIDSLNEPFLAHYPWIAHTALRRKMPSDEEVRDAVFATMGELSAAATPGTIHPSETAHHDFAHATRGSSRRLARRLGEFATDGVRDWIGKKPHEEWIDENERRTPANHRPDRCGR